MTPRRPAVTHEAIGHDLQGLFDSASDNFGILVLVLSADNVLPLVVRLRFEFGLDQLLDVTAVDYPQRSPRFEVVYQLRGSAHQVRVRLKVPVPEDRPVVPTLTSLYGSARFLEREVHDMYGIGFEGNADLRPILLYDGFVGHPLRKDYPMEMEQPITPYRR